jgi:hypothetical protein
MFEVSGGTVPWAKHFVFRNKRLLKQKTKPQPLPQVYGRK